MLTKTFTRSETTRLPTAHGELYIVLQSGMQLYAVCAMRKYLQYEEVACQIPWWGVGSICFCSSMKRKSVQPYLADFKCL